MKTETLQEYKTRIARMGGNAHKKVPGYFQKISKLGHKARWGKKKIKIHS